MKKKIKVIYTVYKIEVNGIVRYIGRTNNLHRRSLSHNNLFKKGFDKELYNKLREEGFEGKIELLPIHICGNKVESKRFEMYSILVDYFKFEGKNLWQNIPNISDR